MSDVIEHIRRQFQRNGHRSYGDVIEVHEHMLQTAYQAERKGADSELITASLLHDYGHLLVDLPEDAARRGVDGRVQLRRTALTVNARSTVPAARTVPRIDWNGLLGVS